MSIVVGSGASGGWAAKRLSEAGMKVAMSSTPGSRSTTATSPSTSRTSS